MAGLESVPAEEKAAAGGGIKTLQYATDPRGLDRRERGDRWRRYRARLGLVVPRWRTESGLECRHLVVMRGGLHSASVGFVFGDEARSRGHKRERAQLRAAIAALIERYPCRGATATA